MISHPSPVDRTGSSRPAGRPSLLGLALLALTGLGVPIACGDTAAGEAAPKPSAASPAPTTDRSTAAPQEGATEPSAAAAGLPGPDLPVLAGTEPGVRTPSLAAATAEGPGLSAPEPVHDFGTVYAGARLDHTFPLEAVGTEPLVIQKIKPGCGCTVATPVVVREDGTRTPYELEQPLEPGTKLELLVSFDTSGKRGPQAKRVNIYCNDPRGVERLTLEVKLEEFLNTVPDTLRLGRLSVGESRTGEIVMTTRGSGPVKLSVDPRRIPAELQVEFEPKKPDADGRSTSWTVKVTLGGETMRAGPFQFRVPVYSDVENPLAPEHPRPDQRWLGGTIWVTADVLDIYTYSPRQLFFGPVAPDTTISRGLTFNSYDEDYPLEELEAEIVGLDDKPLAHADLYHVNIEPGDAEGTWSVELLVDGLPEGSGLFEGNLRFLTKNPERPHVDVPFKGIVR